MRLQEDHEHAALLAQGLAEVGDLLVDQQSLQTNMVFIKVESNYPQFQAYLAERGIIFPKNPNKMNSIRLVTHRDISRADIERVLVTVKSYYQNTTKVPI